MLSVNTEGEEIYCFGAKVGKDVDIIGKEGVFVSMEIPSVGKTTLALVPAADSLFGKSGYNLIFMTCSPHCARNLKSIFQPEK